MHVNHQENIATYKENLYHQSSHWHTGLFSTFVVSVLYLISVIVLGNETLMRPIFDWRALCASLCSKHKNTELFNENLQNSNKQSGERKKMRNQQTLHCKFCMANIIKMES